MAIASAKAAADLLNKALIPFGIKIVRAHDWNDPEQFLPLEKTLADARASGLSLGDYVDATHNVPGATQATIDFMAEVGVLSDNIDTVCEIGPGTGRYLEKIMGLCHPSHYEIYETATPWAEYLVKTYKVISRETSGSSMQSTPSSSLDLVHADKVFVATTFITTCSYWMEMVRCVRDDGYIVFDIITEDCMRSDILQKWIGDGVKYGSYPAIVPRGFALDFFQSKGAEFLGSTEIPLRPGVTEVLAFRKTKIQHEDDTEI